MAGLIHAMSTVETPTVSVLIGEGGSEAALAFSLADRVLMLQNSIYTPISPEQGARTELRDSDRASEIARALKLTSVDCLQMGIVDDIIPEPAGGAHLAPEEAARLVKRTLMRELIDLRNVHRRTLVRRRQKKFRNMGEYGSRFRTAVRNELKAWRAALSAGMRALRRADEAQSPKPPLPADSGDD
jgi:acetyl-CoA carboxylase alpha subunit